MLNGFSTTRMESFLRFIVIFLRSPVIPLIPPSISQKPPMLRYHRTSARIEVNRYYSPTKSRYSRRYPISHKKRRYILLVVMQKKTNLIEKPDLRNKETKDVGTLFVSQFNQSYTEIFPSQKSVEPKKPIQIDTNQIPSVPSSPNVFVGERIVLQLHLPLFLWEVKFVFLYSMNFFYAVRFGNMVCCK